MKSASGRGILRVNMNTLHARRDCEGRMYLWDASTRQVLGSVAAHDKRIWALDFTPGVSPGLDAAGGGGSHLLASGSDDHLLKVCVCVCASAFACVSFVCVRVLMAVCPCVSMCVPWSRMLQGGAAATCWPVGVMTTSSKCLCVSVCLRVRLNVCMSQGMLLVWMSDHVSVS